MQCSHVSAFKPWHEFLNLVYFRTCEYTWFKKRIRNLMSDVPLYGEWVGAELLLKANFPPVTIAT